MPIIKTTVNFYKISLSDTSSSLTISWQDSTSFPIPWLIRGGWEEQFIRDTNSFLLFLGKSLYSTWKKEFKLFPNTCSQSTYWGKCHNPLAGHKEAQRTLISNVTWRRWIASVSFTKRCIRICLSKSNVKDCLPFCMWWKTEGDLACLQLREVTYSTALKWIW